MARSDNYDTTNYGWGGDKGYLARPNGGVTSKQSGPGAPYMGKNNVYGDSGPGLARSKKYLPGGSGPGASPAPMSSRPYGSVSTTPSSTPPGGAVSPYAAPNQGPDFDPYGNNPKPAAPAPAPAQPPVHAPIQANVSASTRAAMAQGAAYIANNDNTAPAAPVPVPPPNPTPAAQAAPQGPARPDQDYYSIENQAARIGQEGWTPQQEQAGAAAASRQGNPYQPLQQAAGPAPQETYGQPLSANDRSEPSVTYSDGRLLTGADWQGDAGRARWLQANPGTSDPAHDNPIKYAYNTNSAGNNWEQSVAGAPARPQGYKPLGAPATGVLSEEEKNKYANALNPLPIQPRLAGN